MRLLSLIEPLRRHARWTRASVSLLVTLLTAALLSLTPTLDSLERNVERRFDFYVRQKVDRAPHLDPRIQVFVWDDQTTALLAKWRAVTVTDVPLVSGVVFVD